MPMGDQGEYRAEHKLFTLDLPVPFKYYGLNEIWAEAYSEIEGVEWLGTAPLESALDLHGLLQGHGSSRRTVPVFPI